MKQLFVILVMTLVMSACVDGCGTWLLAADDEALGIDVTLEEE